VHQLNAEDLEIQAHARAFVGDLIVYESGTELDGDHLPPDIDAAMRARAREEHLCATNMPRELGGGGCTMLQQVQVLVQERAGRATDALGWTLSTTPQWWPPVATDFQTARWIIPSIERNAADCYAITEENADAGVSWIDPAARRDGDGYLLDCVKWHVTSFNEATYAFFQARLAGGPHAVGHAMSVVDLPSAGVRVVRTPRTPTPWPTTIRSSRSRTCESANPTGSARKATDWHSPTIGSGTKGSWWRHAVWALPSGCSRGQPGSPRAPESAGALRAGGCTRARSSVPRRTSGR
jgi:alkylation response protein AidB-like acyl-CoA dehydrogenase